MNLTTAFMQSEWTKALGWTFVHSLWQIALIGLLLFLLLRFIPGRNAHMRYTISTLALWLIIVMALSTFMIMLPGSTPIKEVTGRVFLMTTDAELSMSDRISTWLELRMPMMLTIWSVGVAILMFRLIVSLAWVRHMRLESIPDSELQLTLNQIIKRLKLKVKPGAAGSTLVTSPVTIGHLKPLILFPVGIINQLTPKEVEAILTHELAHIVRRDYLSNMVQSFIETLFYYHPITWWISSVVRSERENRADDLAVSWCGNQLEYAKALMTVQEMQVQQGPSLAIGFASRKGAMLARVQRILNLPYKNHHQMEKTVLLSLTSLCFLAFTLSSHTDTTPPMVESPIIPHVAFIEAKTDSLPAKGIYRIHKKTDDQDIQIEVEDGDIKELTIDGKEIQPADFQEYGIVIEELFGAIEAPPAMEGFNFMIPAIPEIPMIPEMPMIPDMQFMIENFEIPDMPEIPSIEWEQFMHDNSQYWNGNESNNFIWNGEGMNNIQVITDSMPGGQTKIIIINNGDTSTISADHMMIEWPENPPHMFMQGDIQIIGDELQIHREAERAQMEHMRAQQEQLSNENRNQEYKDTRSQEQLERELRTMNYIDRMPRLSFSDQMVQDGLVKAGEEAEIQLTPDKMKINGEKMPEAIHQKYLDLYQRHQGIQLSGNSKVEFVTKSKQRM